MDSPRERACPSCGAPAAGPQRWCLECGHELPGPRRSALRPVVGIATTLAVLVGAASAGGYTLLRHEKPLPSPAQTVAQAPPATTAPGGLPPASESPAPGSTPYVPSTTPGSGLTGSTPTYHLGAPSPPRHRSTTSTHPSGRSSDGSLQPTTETTPTTTTPTTPQLALTDVALGAAAVVYAPYAPADADLGDPSLTVDGSTATAWTAPALGAASAHPQLGVYVDLADKQKIHTLVLHTPTPGMNVEIYGATSGPPSAITDPGWHHLASRAHVKAKTSVRLPNRAYRYVLVWIVGAPANGAQAAISELSLLSLQPE
ncbi:MAG TPA: hypothetical protein VN635_02890 [Conexibacter sp.]|nr:hypothetical protein [Conexibacter sp.]